MKFCDVSFWQGSINFDTMKSQTDYVILRAGQGSFVDTEFIRNRTECERVGLRWGLYWFYDDRYSPRAQTETLLRLFANGEPRPYEIFADWESTYKGLYGGLNNVVAFMQYIEKFAPWAKLGMYTGYYWFIEHTNAFNNASHFTYLQDKPLWEAWYTHDNTPTDIMSVLVPPPWKYMTYWQYGTPAIGKQYGVESKEIDMNLSLLPPPVTSTGMKLLATFGNQTKEYNEVK